MVKGLAIILMVLGHAFYQTPVERFCATFHMPIFFFAAGFCFNTSHINNPRIFLTKRIKGLWWPYIKWNLLFIVLHYLLYNVNFYEDSIQNISSIFSGLAKMQYSDQLLGAFWFLPALLFASLLGWTYIRLSRGNIKLLSGFIIIAASFAILRNSRYPDGSSAPLLLSSFFYYSVIFTFGFIARIYLTSILGFFNRFRLQSNKALWIIVITGFLYSILTTAFVGGSVMSLMTWEMPLYTFGALVGILWSTLLCYLMRNSFIGEKLIVYGKNTWPLLVWHFSVFKVISILFIVILGIDITNLSQFPILENASYLMMTIYFISGITLPWLIDYIIKAATGLFSRFSLSSSVE